MIYFRYLLSYRLLEYMRLARTLEAAISCLVIVLSLNPFFAGMRHDFYCNPSERYIVVDDRSLTGLRVLSCTVNNRKEVVTEG